MIGPLNHVGIAVPSIEDAVDTYKNLYGVTDISEPTELHQHQQQHTEIKQSQDHLIETGKIHKNYICLWFTI